MLLLLKFNYNSIHFWDASLIVAPQWGPVGGQATANGMLRRCRSPDQHLINTDNLGFTPF